MYAWEIRELACIFTFDSFSPFFFLLLICPLFFLFLSLSLCVCVCVRACVWVCVLGLSSLPICSLSGSERDENRVACLLITLSTTARVFLLMTNFKWKSPSHHQSVLNLPRFLGLSFSSLFLPLKICQYSIRRPGAKLHPTNRPTQMQTFKYL